MTPYLSSSALHTIPSDIREALLSNDELVFLWNNLTPLARNEWICWIISAKKPETRERRISRMKEDLSKGKKRPCCWSGCPHR